MRVFACVCERRLAAHTFTNRSAGLGSRRVRGLACARLRPRPTARNAACQNNVQLISSACVCVCVRLVVRLCFMRIWINWRNGADTHSNIDSPSALLCSTRWCWMQMCVCARRFPCNALNKCVYVYKYTHTLCIHCSVCVCTSVSNRNGDTAQLRISRSCAIAVRAHSLR